MLEIRFVSNRAMRRWISATTPSRSGFSLSYHILVKSLQQSGLLQSEKGGFYMEGMGGN